MRKVPNDLSEEEKKFLALLEGIIKGYTAITLAIIYARIQSPKLSSFPVSPMPRLPSGHRLSRSERIAPSPCRRCHCQTALCHSTAIKEILDYGIIEYFLAIS
jgi:hypothetical protein